MSKNQVLYGSPILMGDNTIPGVKYSPELEEVIPKIIKAGMDWGLEPYPPIIELMTYDEISEIAAYGGFPVRYPHWSFGMEFEELSRGYEHSMHKIYEMVINSNPSIIYCLDSNPLLDHITVIIHALGHSDFFKNNTWFAPTTENSVNELANHGTRIRRYINRWGLERVQQFIDWVLMVDDLIDPSEAWKQRQVKENNFRDVRKYNQPRRLKLPETDGEIHDYMNDFINNEEWMKREEKRIAATELRNELNLFPGPHKDVLGYLVKNAPLQPWQQDIISMLYLEAQYFAPQRVTKMLNEGWASYTDFCVMARQHWTQGSGIHDYAKHKMGVLGGKYSMNPYAVGFKLFLHIEEKWNKGRFGREYDQCEDMEKKKNWDTKAGLGHKKVFEVRKVHNDVTAIHEFVDQEFVDKYQMYIWNKFPMPDGSTEYRIVSRDAKQIKKMLMQKYANGGRPDIRLADPNYANKHIFLLQHQWEGRTLAPKYAKATLPAIWCLWNNGGKASKYPVALATRNKDEKEMVFVCTGTGENDSAFVTRKEFEETFG